jgi:uncharacterized UBP type Zn finger protein
MIKTMSVFENIYLVEKDEALTIDIAQSIVDEGTSNFYQHHKGELVQNLSVWNDRETAVNWLHENDYF